MRRLPSVLGVAALLAALVACEDTPQERPVEGEPADGAGAPTTPPPAEVPAPPGGRFEAPTAGGAPTPMPPAQLDAGRRDPRWRPYAGAVDVAAPTVSETLDALTPEAVDLGKVTLPLGGEAEGPSVVAAQVLLDRAWFSPGIVDGRWGMNAEKAVVAFQRRQGLPPSGVVDAATWERLLDAAGRPPAVIVDHVLAPVDVEGPFVSIPEDVQAKAELDCLCYERLSEKLAERFHVAPDVLAKLNPGVDLDAVQAGATLKVPAVREPAAPGPQGQVARVLVSDGGGAVQAVDAQGAVLMHFPATLGSTFQPSPEGKATITSIHPDPWWHYQPTELDDVPDTEPEARLPPGPNNAVGVVWMDLSLEGYGIHGTSAPETIGYATSHGCVRLTNWDAKALSERLTPGTPVQFVDVEGTQAG